MGGVDDFRRNFAVCDRLAYLNAGTDGPLPSVAASAMRTRIGLEEQLGRSGNAYFETIGELWERVRSGIAGMCCAAPDCIALTSSTTDGINTVVWGMGLNEGDEVVTSDEEHPGLLAPLAAARERLGIEVTVVPLSDVAAAAGPRTRLVACSHVSWVSGRVAPVDELAQLDLPVLLDGAQALGAIPVDVQALNCDFYAAPGQKWLCGPDGSGALYVKPAAIESLALAWPGYESLAEPRRPLDLVPRAGARRFDTGFMPGSIAAGLAAALDLFAAVGWGWIHETAQARAARLRALLEERVRLEPGGPATLVAWRADQAAEVVQTLARSGVVVREIPGRNLVRASVGAFNDERDLERLVAAVQGSLRPG